MEKKLVAIVGMCGSGKSVATEYLEEKGWTKIYFGGVNLRKVKEAGLEINEANEKMMREKLRKDYGMGAFASILLPDIKEAIEKNDTVLDGLYSWDELKILNEEFKGRIVVVGVVADKELRYGRLTGREVRPLTNEQAVSRDVAEIENSAKGGPIVFADYYIYNNGTKEEYINRLNEILEQIN